MYCPKQVSAVVVAEAVGSVSVGCVMWRVVVTSRTHPFVLVGFKRMLNENTFGVHRIGLPGARSSTM